MAHSRDEDRPRHRDRDRDRAKKDKSSSKKDKKHSKKRSKKASSSHSHSHNHSHTRRDVTPISVDDYFLRATEFRVWLQQTKSQYVEELSSEECLALFEDKFVPRWNRGKLADMFYTGIPERVLEATKRTRHAWGFVAKLDDAEKMALASAKDSVGVATRKDDLLVPTGASAPAHRAADSSSNAAANGNDGKRRRSTRDEEEEDATRSRRHGSSSKRTAREREREVLEELAPRATGREAQLERRREVHARVHGAAQDRDANQDGLDVDDAFLMGGGSAGGRRGAVAEDDLQRRLTQRSQARDRRGREMQERADAAAAKETARMDKFLQDMGLAGGNARPITIAPRAPPPS